MTKAPAAEPARNTDSGEIVIRVINEAGVPQADATVGLFMYDRDSRSFKNMSRDAKTDHSGIAGHDRLATGNTYIARAKTRDGLLAYRHCSLLRDKPRLEIDLRVSDPAVVLIHVHDESGKPVPGVSIWSISHAGPNGPMWFTPNSLSKPWELPANPSNEAGELLLPELPGGKIDVQLIHPDYAPCELKGIRINKKTVAEATLPRGVKLTFKIEMDGKASEFNSLEFTIRHEPSKHPSSLSGPLPELRPDGTVQLTVAAGKYSRLAVYHSGDIVTPIYSELGGQSLANVEFFELTPGNDHFTFQLHRTVKVRGRVLDEVTGKPIVGQSVQGDVLSGAEEGPLARFATQWSNVGYAATNDRGEFEIDLAAGSVRLTFMGQGYVSRLRHYSINVVSDGSTIAPDILVRPIPKVRGVVQDQSGEPLPGAVVRFRGSLLTYDCQPTVTDALGRFELSPHLIPINFKTEESLPDETLVAFHPYEPLGAELKIRYDGSTALDNVELRMKPQDYRSLVTSYPEELTSWQRGIIPADQKDHSAAISLVGNPAPELDGAAWLSTDKSAMSLSDFRGKFVLLQFWATWCGPCHQDMPNVKLAYELYKDKGLVVIGVHDNSMPLDAIKEDVAKNGLLYPIVVDHPDGRIYASYREHGMAPYYPSYALIGPDGNVLLDDATVAGPRLEGLKTEIIRQMVMTHSKN